MAEVMNKELREKMTSILEDCSLLKVTLNADNYFYCHWKYFYISLPK